MKTASTGRTHDCTRPICINIKKTTLAKGEPSTHDPKRKFDAPSARRILAEFLTQGGELWQTAHRISLPSRRMSVAKAELGTKRFCLNCGAKFYDLKRNRRCARNARPRWNPSSRYCLPGSVEA